MKINQQIKHLGQSWQTWFIECLVASDFKHTGPNKYVKDNVEVRIFRAEKNYQVWVDGLRVATGMQFISLNMTGMLYHDTTN